MFYREAGQFKTSYAADMAVMPLLQDRIGLGVDPVHRRRHHSVFRQQLFAPGGDDSVSDVFVGDDRAQSADRLHRAVVARHRRFHGCGCLRLLQAHDLFPRREHHRLDRDVRLFLGGGWRRVRVAVATYQGLLSCGRNARRAVLPVMVLHSSAVVLQLQLIRRDRGADPHAVRHSDHRRDRDQRHTLLCGARDRRRDDMVCVQSRAWPDRPDVDGGARPGSRRRADRHPLVADQAARLRCLIVLLRRCRGACWFSSGMAAPSPQCSTSTRASSSCSW